MLDRFRERLAESGLLPPGAKVVVGYSGGADSGCLLHLLKRLEYDVVAAHLHHGQRSEADEEAAGCQAQTESWGIPYAGGRADVPAIAALYKVGLEEAGRQARYDFLNRVRKATECDWIATAHTKDDQIETILFRMARGAGLKGLGGIPERRDRIVRPLLWLSRAESRAYCEAQGVWFHDDPANLDLANSRTRIRLRVIPELEEAHPGFKASLLRLSEVASEEDAFLDGAAAAVLERIERPLNGDLRFLTEDVELALDRESLGVTPPVLLRRALRLAVEAVGGRLNFAETQAIVEGLDAAKGAVTTEEGTHVVEWTGDEVHVRTLREDEPFRHLLEIPGSVDSDVFGWSLSATLGACQRAPERRSLETCLSLAECKGDLFFRSVAPGDKLQPLGFEGHRKLSDLLAEAGLTQAARRRLPIICDIIGPVWAPGVCLSERVRPSVGDRSIFLTFNSLRCERNAGESKNVR